MAALRGGDRRLGLVGVVIVLHLPGSRDATPRPARPTASVIRGGFECCGARGGAAGGTRWDFRMFLVLARRSSAASGRRAAGVVLAGHRRVVPIGGLPSQPSGYQFIRAAGGWAVRRQS